MVFKNKSSTIYNILITLLISLILLMLYLGNYNLIEGNNSSSQVMSNLDSLLEKNTNTINVLKDNTPYNTGCNQDINKINSDNIKKEGGVDSAVSKTINKANQSLTTICSMNIS